MLRFRGDDWCRSMLAAMLTITMSSAVMGQPASRISARESDLNDVNRLLNDGVGGPQGGVFRSGVGALSAAPVDLSHVDLRTLQTLLNNSISEAEQLYRLLDTDYRRYPELRPLLADLVQMRARAARLNQDVRDGIPLERMLPQFQQLNSDWRLLSHQLSQSPRVSRTTLDAVKRIDGLGAELERMFKMDPQLDRRQVLLELSILRSSIRNLIDELELDPNGTQQTLNLVYDARKLEQQVARVEGMVLDQISYATVVAEYKSYEQMWASLNPRISSLNNRYIERAIRNIMDADDQMHDLLWLEKSSNRQHLRQVADDLLRDVDEFYNRTPLKLLLSFRDVASILETADNFYGVVHNFRETLDRNQSDQDILDAYSYVEQYGADFIRSFAGMKSSAGRVVLKNIEDGIFSLRNELNLSGNTNSIDTRALLPIAANLGNLADHLNFDVKHWLERSNESFRTDALQASALFAQRSQGLQQFLQSRPMASDLNREVANLYEDWRRVYQYLSRCNTEDRQHIAYLARDISDAILQLRAPLDLAQR
ncbi:MAG: hypothetical protein R3C19_07100 [Planctomycetaceae bacterium]